MMVSQCNGRNISNRLLAANKNSSADLLKLGYLGKTEMLGLSLSAFARLLLRCCGENCNTLRFSIGGARRILVISRLPVTPNFKRSTEKLLFEERTSGDIFAKQVHNKI